MTSPDSRPDETLRLLQRLHRGEEAALRLLLERDMDWIRGQVHRRLGPRLRGHAETQDFVQEAALRALRYGPRFLVSDQGRFRALLARIVENVLRDAADHIDAEKRGGGAVPVPDESLAVPLDQNAASITSPSQAAQRNEERAWLEIALELLEAEDRQVIRLREWERMEFEAIGARMALTPDAARMRFHRALARLARKVEQIRKGGLDEAL